MRSLIAITASLCIALPAATLAAEPEEGSQNEFTQVFPLEDCRFVPRGGNAFVDLTPGRQQYFSNQPCVAAGECEELEELWITVLDETRKVELNEGGRTRRIRTRVVEEMEMADGELVEISRNFLATCRPMRDVYYFGEEVDIYEDGEIVSHEGAWLAGIDDARPGLIMPDSGFLLGLRYFQELAPGLALDRAEHVGYDLSIQTPAGAFEGCIEVSETTPLEPDAESVKRYCPNVGLVADDELVLHAFFEPEIKKQGKKGEGADGSRH